MQLSRRRFLGALVAAPVVITTPGLLMPIKDWGRQVRVSSTFVLDHMYELEDALIFPQHMTAREVMYRREEMLKMYEKAVNPPLVLKDGILELPAPVDFARIVGIYNAMLNPPDLKWFELLPSPSKERR